MNRGSQSSTTTSVITSTSAGDGTTTPTPTQSGIASDCNKFYHVVKGDGCYDIASANKISLDDFCSWNPAVGKDCGNLWPDYYACVGTAKLGPTKSISATSKTVSGGGVAPPTPTQAVMTAHCKKFHLVVSGDGCYNISSATGIPLDDFYAWNPAVGKDCGKLSPDYYVCVDV
ncbi:hypothetical protein FQN49_004646 [Arthroderma sp. PD_2]|nr:hypothetical protein FQN49_004646 [Arthroderma sp. PD_2]